MSLFHKSDTRREAEDRLGDAEEALRDYCKHVRGVRGETPEFSRLEMAVYQAEQHLKAVKRAERR